MKPDALDRAIVRLLVAVREVWQEHKAGVPLEVSRPK